jgi:succinoglycan biosynthesis transport protein ExoP
MSLSLSAASRREYTLRDALTVLFKRKTAVVTFFLVVMTVVVLATFLPAPTYEVSAAIVLKKARADVSMKEAPGAVTEEEVNSETQLLLSRPLIEEVLRTLGAGKEPPPMSLYKRAAMWLYERVRGYRLSPFDSLVLDLQRHLTVTPIRKSNVVEIAYRSKDPVWATNVVRTFTEKHLEMRSRVYQPPQAVAFFEQQVQEAKERMAQGDRDLASFLEGTDVTVIKSAAGTESLAAQKQAELQQLSDLEKRLAETSAAVHEYERMVDELGRRLSGEPDRLASANRLNLDPTIEEVEKELVSLQLRRDELIQKYTPENRLVRDIDTRIALARQRRQEVQERLGEIDRTEPNPVHQQIRTEMLRAQGNLEGARARQASLSAQVAASRQTTELLNRKSVALERLRREMSTAEESYNLYQRRFEEARISTAMDQEKILSVSIARPATPPLKPVAPNKKLNLALGLFLAIVGAVGFAFVLEQLDHTFTTGLDVERHLGIPLLGSIPEGARAD